MTLSSIVLASVVASSDATGERPQGPRARVTVFDDGVKLRGEPERPLPTTPFPNDAPIALFALPGETIALQLVIDADAAIEGVHAELSLARSDAGVPVVVTTYAEHFVRVARPSGNDREPGSLAFSASAAPPADMFVGLVADALLPRLLTVEAHGRGALWLDVFVPEDATTGTAEGTLFVVSQRGIVSERTVRLQIGSRNLPYAAAKVAVFYDPATLDRRMGGRAAELSLRQVLHAHHVSALPERTSPDGIDLDLDALSGALYTRSRDYRGPGQNEGEGVYALGAYGSLGEPSEEKVRVVERFVERIRARGALERTEVFVYAVDEDCKSPRAARWLALLAGSSAKAHVKVGVTCDDPPAGQDATLVMVPASNYDPETAELAKARGRSVWAYNGMRPHAGPLMIDVPAVDLRANGWIAVRYGVSRWFYWESTYWLDDHRGGGGRKDGRDGWDPYVTAETFHNKDGDHAMGDGVLLYPGTQRGQATGSAGGAMTDFGEQALYPSVRLKNLRRGVLDAGYLALAREKDPDRTEAIVRRMIPAALARVRERDRTPWTDDPAAWRDARRELFAILEGPAVTGRGALPGEPRSKVGSLVWIAAFAAVAAATALVARALRRRP